MKSTGRQAAIKQVAPIERVPGSFELEILIRGRVDLLHRETCEGLEDATRIGEKWFRAFQARNPWFVQDSKRRRIFILLDSETESCVLER